MPKLAKQKWVWDIFGVTARIAYTICTLLSGQEKDMNKMIRKASMYLVYTNIFVQRYTVSCESFPLLCTAAIAISVIVSLCCMQAFLHSERVASRCSPVMHQTTDWGDTCTPTPLFLVQLQDVSYQRRLCQAGPIAFI